MKVTRVRFDEQTFLLDPEQDSEQTKQLIVAAARDGSDFVDFHTIGYGVISLLVTPNIPVRFETVEHTEEELEQLEADPPPIDQNSMSDFDF